MTDHTDAREALRTAELELMLQRERVAELRRALPPGPVVEGHIFDEGPADLSQDGPIVQRTLGDLCTDRPLVLYHFMFGNAFVEPCPMCTMWADGWNGLRRPLEQRIDFAIVTSAPIADTRDLARQRGWDDLRLLSAAGSSFKRDIGGEDADGGLSPFVSVYERDGDDVRLSYAGSAHISGDHWRGVDLLSPVWHLLDLTRPGRGDWMPDL